MSKSKTLTPPWHQSLCVHYSLSAQQESASITVTLSGAAVPGARVTIRNQASGALFNSVSDADDFTRHNCARECIPFRRPPPDSAPPYENRGASQRPAPRRMPMQVGTVSET
jgi:hypothetical protein